MSIATDLADSDPHCRAWCKAMMQGWAKTKDGRMVPITNSAPFRFRVERRRSGGSDIVLDRDICMPITKTLALEHGGAGHLEARSFIVKPGGDLMHFYTTIIYGSCIVGEEMLMTRTGTGITQ